MLNLFNKKEKAPLEFSVFNLEITRDKTMSQVKEYDSTSQYIGEFIVRNSGELEREIDSNLHTYETKLGYCEDHVHLPGGEIVDISTRNNGLVPNIKFKHPHFKLNALYSFLQPEISKKPKLLTKYIKLFNPEFQFNSIATHEETKLKLLENAYKRYVSDQ